MSDPSDLIKRATVIHIKDQRDWVSTTFTIFVIQDPVDTMQIYMRFRLTGKLDGCIRPTLCRCYKIQ